MLIALIIVAVQAAGAQNPLARAKEYYAAAAYEDALKILEALGDTVAPADTRDVAVYRVFCLLALDRNAEAAKAIEAIVRADPLYSPSDAHASPRMRARFEEVRRPLLPVIIRETYARARDAFDRRQFGAAIAGFDRVIAVAAGVDSGDLEAPTD